MNEQPATSVEDANERRQVLRCGRRTCHNQQDASNDACLRIMPSAGRRPPGWRPEHPLIDVWDLNVNPNWHRHVLHQDAKHFMGNMHEMVRKRGGNAPFFKRWTVLLSQAMFKPIPESLAEVKEHLTMLYLTNKDGPAKLSDEQKERLFDEVPRSYWRRMCRYWCPPPLTMLRDILRVYQSFIPVTDPTNEHKSFYITNLNDKRNHVTVMREQTKHIRYVSACHFSLPFQLAISACHFSLPH